MSMTESEAIEKILYMGVGRSGLENENSIIAKSLNELQQYRAIGTVERVSKLKERFDKAKSLFFDEQKKRRTYEAIGTVSEFRELKEKATAKEAEWIFDDFSAKFGNPYRCSNCDEEFGDTYNYCPNCGCDMYAD